MTPTILAPDLPPMAVATRAERLAAGLGAAQLDALLVTHGPNVRYLSGFSGSAAQLLVTAAGLTLVTDGRYVEQAAAELRASGVAAAIEMGRGASERGQLLRAATTGVRRLGLEAAHLSWAQQREMAETWFPALEVVPTTELVEDLRAVKDGGEVARIEAGAALADAALAALRARLGAGVREREFALDLEVEMRRLGADDRAFDFIVAAGPNGAKPHARPSDRMIGDGDLVVLDFGALVDGYRSDVTRTLCIGTPTPTQQRMLEVVTAAQAAGGAAVAPGKPAAEIDQVCRRVISDAGWGDAFLHTTGHGIGLDLHERPWVAQDAEAPLVAGHVITIEPGVYLPKHGGVRVEDLVLVMSHGVRLLTHSPTHWTL